VAGVDCNDIGDGEICDYGTDPFSCCADGCSTAGEQQCNGTVIETCTQVGACLQWVAGTDCNDIGDGEICDYGTDPFSCCANTCQVLNVTQCNGTLIETCTQVGACLQWVGGIDCSDNGEVCDGSSDPAICVPDRHGIWENFSSNGENDLEGCLTTFTPNVDNPEGYDYATVCDCPALLEVPGSGTTFTVLTLTDDGSAEYNLAHMVPIDFYSTSYTSFYVNANGNITFGAGDGTFTFDLDAFFAMPRIAGLALDLRGGDVYVDEWADRVVISYIDLPTWAADLSQTVTFQIVIDDSGEIEFSHALLDVRHAGWVGLSNGFAGTDPAQTNYTDNVVVNPFPRIPGEVIFTEVHYNVDAGSETGGEYIELYNASVQDLDLRCCRLTDNSGGHDFSSLVIPAGSHAILVRNGDPAVNGGIVGGYEYGGSIQLLNTAAEVLTLTCPGVVIDELPFDTDDPWPAGGNGVSMQLSVLAYGAGLNDNPAAWCDSSLPYGDGDLGTPGLVNDVCGTVYYFEDFEVDPGWVTVGDWEWGTPDPDLLPNGPAACAGGTGCYGTGMSTDYSRGMTFDTNFVAIGAFDFSTVTEPNLLGYFDMWLRTEENFDFARIEASIDGANWVVVPAISPPYNSGSGDSWMIGTGGLWIPAVGDLTAYITQSTVFIRWVLSSDTLLNEFPGFYIDNSAIIGID
ncbi:MAG: lamin tail domain-containing protein, partial [Deltaproteobacteria bacterium]|nr:lamin tail domain-containing protein [Deltaproteobacteria bacterium]